MSIAERAAGEIVGEMALLDAGPRSASARAIEDCILVSVSEEQIRHRLHNADPILRLCFGVIMACCRDAVALPRPNGTVAPNGRVAPTRAAGAHFSPSLKADFEASIDAMMTERALRLALNRNEFELYLQPIVHLGTEALAGFEALIRWRHPEKGLVHPMAFIPVAEASELIVEITQWVVCEVGRIMPEIMRAALQNPAATDGPLFLSINVGGHDLARASFPEMVGEMLRSTGIAPSTLKLEITETTVMRDPVGATEALSQCREAGMGVAIDDFGTGYSSLSDLSKLPITTLKVDREFVRAMLTTPSNRKIIQTILRLADEIGIPVVAEGIEEPAEADALAEMGCAYGQGYRFSRPVPLAETLALTKAWRLAPYDAALIVAP
ncbi:MULTISPECIES: EAL domain-containing protein [unclassified Methylobacterium]|uniref:EAL domain-containing protein n=1 Tax=unclassified Methylobacterium TaxID=2615210 RepID=UPI001FF07051|nr:MULTISPECIES: EAL domain-containing protein [unclassified Methylobacterium]